jgi:hypothetical protein
MTLVITSMVFREPVITIGHSSPVARALVGFAYRDLRGLPKARGKGKNKPIELKLVSVRTSFSTNRCRGMFLTKNIKKDRQT